MTCCEGFFDWISYLNVSRKWFGLTKSNVVSSATIELHVHRHVNIYNMRSTVNYANQYRIAQNLDWNVYFSSVQLCIYLTTFFLKKSTMAAEKELIRNFKKENCHGKLSRATNWRHPLVNKQSVWMAHCVSVLCGSPGSVWHSRQLNALLG